MKKIYGLVALSPLSAFAGVDVTAVTGSLTDIATVGAAVFGVYVAIKLTKWVRRAM